MAWHLHENGVNLAFHQLLLRLPSSPRCAVCGAPFAGVGSRLAG